MIPLNISVNIKFDCLDVATGCCGKDGGAGAFAQIRQEIGAIGHLPEQRSCLKKTMRRTWKVAQNAA